MKSLRPIKDVRGRKCRRPDSYYLGSAESPSSDSFSVRLKSSLSDGVASPPCSPQVLCPCPVLAFIQASDQSGAGIAAVAGFLKGGAGARGGAWGGEEGGWRGEHYSRSKEGRGEGWVTITTRVQGVWACTSPLHQDSSWPPS